jgi:hypothetical protein
MIAEEESAREVVRQWFPRRLFRRHGVAARLTRPLLESCTVRHAYCDCFFRYLISADYTLTALELFAELAEDGVECPQLKE